MVDDLRLVWRDLRSRPVPTGVAVAVVALAIALLVAVSHLNDGLQRGIVRASDPFGVLVIGAKGSGQQLVLSTLLLQGLPVGNIPEAMHERYANDPRVALAVPLAFGDNVSGARLIGTEPSFMELSPGPGAPPSFRIDRGRMWAADHELVLGSRAAAETGLSLGDIVQPGHGVEPGLDADIHDVPHTVVGILAPSGTAFDGAVLTSLQSVIAVHEDHEEEPHAEEPHAEHAITAVLVRPVGFGEANSLWQEAYAGTEVQAAFPGQELGGVFDLLDQAQELLILVGYLASIMAALTLFLAVYAAGATRDRLLAIMRALGARRTTVFRVVMVEALIVALLGAIVGRVIGTVVALAVAGRVTGDSSIPVEIAWLPSLEPWLWLLPVGLGLLAGLVPALRAYRADVLSRLAAN